MKRLVRYGGQILCYGLFAVTLGVHSHKPPYSPRQLDDAVLKVAISHAGQALTPCRRRSAAELEALAPNMRTPLDCPRARSPVEVVIELDDAELYREVLIPRGLARDGLASVYRRVHIPSGRHRLRARLKDHIEQADFAYAKEGQVDLAPGQVVVIDFNARTGGFEFR